MIDWHIPHLKKALGAETEHLHWSKCLTFQQNERHRAICQTSRPDRISFKSIRPVLSAGRGPCGPPFFRFPQNLRKRCEYGKSANFAITSEITSSVPIFQGTMAQVSEEEAIISLLEKMVDSSTGDGDTVTLPATYDAFTLTMPTEGRYSAYLQSDKQYLLSTALGSAEEFDLVNDLPPRGRSSPSSAFSMSLLKQGRDLPFPPRPCGSTASLPCLKIPRWTDMSSVAGLPMRLIHTPMTSPCP